MEGNCYSCMSGFKTDGISGFMTFSQFAKILRPFYGANDNQDFFVIKLFDNILDDYNDTAKDNSSAHQESQSYNPFKNTDRFQADTIARYFKGTPISPDTYKEILKYVNKGKFEQFMQKPENPTEEAEQSLVASIKEIYPDTTPDNYCGKYAELFFEIIDRGSKAPKGRSGRKKKIHYPKTTNAYNMELLEEKIASAAVAIAKTLNEENLPEDPHIAYCINEKIKKDHNLRRKIENDLVYFGIVNKAFQSAAENHGKPPLFICNCIHNHYLKSREIKNDEAAIVEDMKTYIASMALIDADSDVARIIVSYFIQLCEVFDAPSR